MLQDLLFLGLSYFVANYFQRDNRAVRANGHAIEWCIEVCTLPTSLRFRVDRTFFGVSPNIVQEWRDWKLFGTTFGEIPKNVRSTRKRKEVVNDVEPTYTEVEEDIEPARERKRANGSRAAVPSTLLLEVGKVRTSMHHSFTRPFALTALLSRRKQLATK